MAKLTQNEIRTLARKIVQGRAGGIRYSALVETIAAQSPDTNRNTIHGSVWDLATRYPNEIVKPSRGLFMAAGQETAPSEKSAKPPLEEQIDESLFYGPFADFLRTDLDEATVAFPLGGAGLKSKWGTPDVVGVYRPRASDMIKFSPEVISAEVKLEGRASIEAFGQAVAYRLFSTKSYVVMPSTISEEDQSRLEALCMLFGIGFVLFTPDPKAPNFAIRTKAQWFSPDMFYVNEFADRLKHHRVELFEQLFG